MTENHTPEEQVPVLIVGAGLAGLSTATFLGIHDTNSLVVERHPSTSTAPKARGQNPDVMEAFRIAGINDEVRAAGFDMSKPMEIVIGSTVAGKPLQTLVQSFDFDLSAVTPETMGMAGQERTEAILARRATEAGAEIRFHTELESFSSDEDGVTAVLRDVRTDERRRVRAQYLVAADGWRTSIRSAAGIGVHGHGSVSQWVGLVIRADLEQLLGGREFVLVYLQNPALHGGAGVFGATDEPGRYVFQFGYDAATEDPADFDTDFCTEQVRIGVGIDDLDVTIEDFAITEFAHRLADRYQSGRVLLVGDAAHLMPPTGGQGGNTAVMDGFYLAWKLAAVTKGQAGPGLLASHDSERRRFGEFIADWQYQNLLHRMTPGGVDDHGDHADDHGRDAAKPSGDHHDQGGDQRGGAGDGLGMLLGYRVVDGAVIAEPDDDHAPFENVFTPTGRPGSRLPHLWLQRAGERTSIVDLLGRSFTVITADPAWRGVATRVSDELGLEVDVLVITADDVQDLDHHRVGSWTELYGIGEQGASLIRPDRFVAWRTTEPASAEELIKSLRMLLDR